MTRLTRREIVLSAKPRGVPRESDFRMVAREAERLRDGEARVRVLYLSLDPGMRSQLRDDDSPYRVGEPIRGRAVGRVIESRSARFQIGDVVVGRMAWSDLSVGDERTLRKVDGAVRPSEHLGVLGQTGFVAYVGLLEIGGVRAGDTVFVSGAAGAIGSVAGQVAKLRGCTVIGSAGSDEKVAFLLDDLGFDSAFNYQDIPPAEALPRHAPSGVDVYFDNVGGPHLEAALDNMCRGGRIVSCGSVALYNQVVPPPGPRNLRNMVTRRLTMRGFVIYDHEERLPAFLRDMTGWVEAGLVKSRETMTEGLENAPRAFISMLQGGNIGKAIVRVADG